MWLLVKLSDYHETLHAKSAKQDFLDLFSEINLSSQKLYVATQLGHPVALCQSIQRSIVKYSHCHCGEVLIESQIVVFIIHLKVEIIEQKRR